MIGPDGTISDLIFNSHGILNFFSPESIEEELLRHRAKLAYYSKLSANEIDKLYNSLIKRIEVINLSAVSDESWKKAVELVKEIDEFDAPFLALTIELKAILWTGDKKLISGLKKKEFDSIISTHELIEIRS